MVEIFQKMNLKAKHASLFISDDEKRFLTLPTVYTFVKTDPEANFKWGVRHVAGAQYGRK